MSPAKGFARELGSRDFKGVAGQIKDPVALGTGGPERGSRSAQVFESLGSSLRKAGTGLQKCQRLLPCMAALVGGKWAGQTGGGSSDQVNDYGRWQT